MNNPICLLRSIWRSITLLAWVSGHDYVTEPDTPDNVHVLKCRTCGHCSVGWGWESLEGKK